MISIDDPDGSGAFFEAAAAGTLLAPRCAACGSWVAPYSLRGVAYRDCPVCREATLQWREVTGHATLVTWTVLPDTVSGGRAGATVSGVVELDEGPWLPCAIDVPVERIDVGMAVRVTCTMPDGDGIPIVPTARPL